MIDQQTTIIQPDRMEVLLARANRLRAHYLKSMLRRMVQAGGRGWSAMLARIRSNRIQNELSVLSDRELADIGLTRGAIPMVAKQVSRGQPLDRQAAPSADRHRPDTKTPANLDRPDHAVRVANERHAA